MDIDFISKIFKIFQTDLHHFLAPVFSKIVNISKSQSFEISKNIIFKRDVEVYLFLLGVLLFPKIKILVLGRKGTFRNPEIIELISAGFSHRQIGK